MEAAPYPTAQDAEIRKWAERLSKPDVISLLDTARKMVIGEVMSLDRLGDKWSPNARERLSTINTRLKTRQSTVDNVWSGDAAEAYKAWVGGYAEGIKGFKSAFESAREALHQFRTDIVGIYGEVIALIGRIAGELAAATGSIVGGAIGGVAGGPIGMLIGALTAGQVEAYRLLGVFVSECGAMINLALRKAEDFKNTAAKLASSVAELENVVPMQARVGNQKDWKVRPR
ncbi:hypothetical protein JOF53_006676 [Crossiella equi]|uniref:WXG100 family type VII secretion target n=1 Tax=Crossiella equi TaxID=130796 RepID=A0ABS5ANN4_9PSEU|nr:hypothetical protein [Crossiella equi]MBP2477804.1 hypothetical protein [Crossiella equi]